MLDYPEPPKIEQELSVGETTFNEQDELPKFELSPIVEKNYFLGTPVTVVIKDVILNKWKKPSLIIQHPDKNLCGQLNISKSLFMELQDKFGTTKGDFVNKQVTLIGNSWDEGEIKGIKINLAQ